MSTMVTCPTCGARWQSQATSGRTRCGRCRKVVTLPRRRNASAMSRTRVTCPSCGHDWQSQATSGRTRCGQCRTLVYLGAVEGVDEGDRAPRPSPRQPPGRYGAPIRPQTKRAPSLSTPTSQRSPLLAVLGTFVEWWAGASSDRAASIPPVAPVLAPAAASVPSGRTLAVRLRCGHTATVPGPRGSVVGRELACPTCGIWTRVEVPALQQCPRCATGIAQCPLSGCPMPLATDGRDTGLP